MLKGTNKSIYRICFTILIGFALLFGSSSQSFAASKKKNKTVEITISAAGDCTLGVDSRYNNTFNSYYNKNGSAYFLKKVKKVFSKDDATIVNLEGPLTTSTSRASKTFTFKGPAKYAKILTKGSVEVVNTANNHTFDFGSSGYSDTTKALKKNKIAYCRNSAIAYKTVKGVKIAFLGFSSLEGVSNATVKSTIQTAKRKKAKIIIVSFHWGIEKDYYPNSTQKSLARSAIDNGATLVLGHHPHVLQGI
jgi:poly-gamma-glutamate synthesis protein (capsule biosynthesis protein)